MFEVFTFYGFFLICIITLIGIGKLVSVSFSLKKEPLPLNEESAKYNYFWFVLKYLLVGMTSIVLISSIYFTQGCTVFILIFPFLGMYFWIKKGKFNMHSLRQETIKFDWKKVICLWAGATFLYGMQVLIWAKNSDLTIIPMSEDIFFYGKISAFLSETGNENNFSHFNLLHNRYTGNAPYHYFDVWLNTSIAHVFGALHTKVFLFITVPLFYFGTFTGICSFFKSNKINIIWVFIFSLGLVFAGGIMFDLYTKIPAYKVLPNGFGYDIFTRPKTGIIMLVLLLASPLLKKNSFIEVIFLLLFLTIAYFTTLPSIFGGIILFLFLNLIIKPFRILDRKLTINLIGITIISTALIFIFYAITGADLKSNLIFPTLDIKLLLRQLIPFVKAPLFNFINYLPFLILLSITFMWWRKNEKPKIHWKGIIWKFGFLVAIGFSGLCSWSMLYYTPDSFQLFDNLNNVLLYVLITFCTVKCIELLFNYKRPFSKILLSVFAILIFINFVNKTTHRKISITSMIGFIEKFDNVSTYQVSDPATLVSDEYLNKIKTEVEAKNNFNPIGVVLRNIENFDDIFSKNLLVERVGFYLAFLFDKQGLFTINDFDIPITEKKRDEQLNTIAFQREIELNLLKNALFYNFVKEQKSSGIFKSIEQSQLDIINQYGIDYIVQEKGATIPVLIKPLIDTTISDDITGEVFIFLKRR